MQDIKFLDYYQWPIKVRQLFYDKEEKDKINIAKSGNLSGVFSSDHINGWIYDVMCSFEKKFNFLPPITIVQKKSNDSCKFSKLDLDHMYEKTSPICSKLREGSGQKDICNIIDYSISEPLLDCSKDELFSWDENDIQKLKVKITELISESEIYQHLQIDELYLGKLRDIKDDNSISSGHWHIIYQCPCTCMTEVAFPIFVEGKVVAVLITGQFIKKDCVGTVEEQLKDIGCQFGDDLKELIQTRTLGVDFEKILDFLQDKLNEFEKHLSDRVERNNNSFMFNISREFTDGLATPASENDFKALLAKKFEALVPKLSLKTLEPFITEQSKRLQKDWHMKSLFPDSGSPSFSANNLLKSKLKDTKSHKSVNGVCCIPKESNDFPYALREKADENSLLFTYEHNEIITIAVLLVPSNELCNEEIGSLIALFSNIFPSIYSKLLYWQTSKEKDEYDLTLKFIAHDLGQFAYSVNSCMDQIRFIWQQLYSTYSLKKSDALSSEFAKLNNRFEMFEKNVDVYMSNINLIAQSAKMRSFSRNINKKEFKFFGKIIYRLCNYFSVALRENHMKLIVPSTEEIGIGSLRTEVYGDPAYIELAVYNLLGNASKYGLVGSCIYLDCSKKYRNINSPHILTVKNYGPAIPCEEREKIFDMGYRVKDNEKTGEGFGLSLVRAVVTDHHGRCWCECEDTPMSEYNVPYLKGGIIYLQEKKGKLNDEEACLLKSLEEENKKLENEGVYNKIAYKDIKFDPQSGSPAEFLAELIKPTYEVAFYMEIPAKHNQEKEDAKNE